MVVCISEEWGATMVITADNNLHFWCVTMRTTSVSNLPYPTRGDALNDHINDGDDGDVDVW